MRHIKQFDDLVAGDDRGTRSPLKRRGDEVMSIVALSTDGKEQVSR